MGGEESNWGARLDSINTHGMYQCDLFESLFPRGSLEYSMIDTAGYTAAWAASLVLEGAEFPEERHQIQSDIPRILRRLIGFGCGAEEQK
jgi:hypothetical protein